MQQPRWLVAAVVTINLIVVALAGATISLDLQGRRHAAETAVRMLAHALGDETEHYLERLDLELRTVADEAARETNPTAMAAFLERHRARLPGLVSIEIFDPAGGLRTTPTATSCGGRPTLPSTTPTPQRVSPGSMPMIRIRRPVSPRTRGPRRPPG